MTERHSFARMHEVVPMPNLNNVQRDSFDWFLKEGLTELFAEMSPLHAATDNACRADRRQQPDGNDARA